MAPPYLTQPELKALTDVLVGNGQFSDSWIDGILVALPHKYRLGLPTAAMGLTPPVRLETALAQLNEDGPLNDGKVPLVVILDRLALEPLQSIVDHAKRLREQLDASASGVLVPVTLKDALRHMRVVGSALFADRWAMRDRIELLASVDGPPAVVVNGLTKVGKSHTRHLLAYAAQKTGAFRLAWVEIEKEQAASFTPDWLIEDLVRSLVPGATAPGRREPPLRWLGDLADWAFHQLSAASQGVPVWVVVDGLKLPDVHPHVRGVVDRIAARVGTPTGPQQLRLVLIDCDPTDIRRAGCVAEEERIAHLTVADAKECLQGVEPARFAQIWPKVETTLMSAAELTTPMVDEVMQEALKP